MDLRRLRAGEWIVALSGVALLGSLFAPWYAGGRTGWEALAANDVILALIAGAAVALWLITASLSHGIRCSKRLGPTRMMAARGATSTSSTGARPFPEPGNAESTNLTIALARSASTAAR